MTGLRLGGPSMPLSWRARLQEQGWRQVGPRHWEAPDEDALGALMARLREAGLPCRMLGLSLHRATPPEAHE